MGGECNYLLRIDGATKQLVFIPDQTWKSQLMMGWSEEAISRLLDTAQASLKQAASQLRLDVEVFWTTILNTWHMQFASTGHWSKPRDVLGPQSNQPRLHQSHLAC